jgi:hypothetical protein
MHLRACPVPSGRFQAACLLSMFPVLLLMLMLLQSLHLAHAQDGETTFRSVRTQFIAALGDPAASSGSGAQTWGLWREDPGPRGVWLNNYEPQLVMSGGVAPASWQFDDNDWWLDVVY